MTNLSLLPLLNRMKDAADWIAKIGGAVAVLVFLFGGVVGLAVPFIQSQLGITALKQSFAAFRTEDFEPFREDILAALQRLTPRPTIAIYDESEAYQIGPCHLRSPCAARFRLRRTQYGVRCDAPDLQPWVRNHGGAKHAAEALSPSIRIDKEWTILISRFVAPREAEPGRAVYAIDLTYHCPEGTVFERTTPVSITLLPVQE